MYLLAMHKICNTKIMMANNRSGVFSTMGYLDGPFQENKEKQCRDTAAPVVALQLQRFTLHAAALPRLTASAWQ
jgi:hypothetical protein